MDCKNCYARPRGKNDKNWCDKCYQEETDRLARFKSIQAIVKMSGVVVWQFSDAPEQYQEMSNAGGDEDWVALVPPNFTYTPYWIDGLDSCRGPQEYEIAEGYKVFIGAHA